MEAQLKQDQSIAAIRKARNDKLGAVFGQRVDGVTRQIYQLFGPSSHQYKKMRPEYATEEGARLKKDKLKPLHEKAAEVIEKAENDYLTEKLNLVHNMHMEAEKDKPDTATQALELNKYKNKVQAMAKDELITHATGVVGGDSAEPERLDIMFVELKKINEPELYGTLRTTALAKNMYEPAKNTEEYDLIEEAQENLKLIKNNLEAGIIYEKDGKKLISHDIADMFPDTVSNIDEL